MPNGDGGNGGGSGGGGVDGFMPTSVRLTQMLQGGQQAATVAMLPSPILAPASLPPTLPLGRQQSGGGGRRGGRGGNLSRVASRPGTLRIGS